MECFNCGNDADMEVFMMINGKMKKISICMDCYKEQMQNMMESMQDENGELNPEKIQNKMFDFFQNNREEFEKFLGEAIDNENFDISQLNPKDFDIKDIYFDNSEFNLLDENLEDIFSNFNKKMDSMGIHNAGTRFDPFKRGKPARDRRTNIYESNSEKTSRQKEIKVLENAAKKKKAELNEYLAKEDYLSAASSRDEMREINKKIMIIKRLTKEGEK